LAGHGTAAAAHDAGASSSDGSGHQGTLKQLLQHWPGNSECRA
jgi:hypothetical protein